MDILCQLSLEAYRLRLLTSLEERLQSAGFGAVAGVDEAGRGCLAGPVVAAAVIPGSRQHLPGVDDSKALSSAAREYLAEEIRRTAVSWSVAAVPPQTIDSCNILEATRKAMVIALQALSPAPDCVLIDAVELPQLAFRRLSLPKADCLSYSVACASILAKVARDGLMVRLDQEYPHYGFVRNKGYAATEHREALQVFGPSPAHRLTFRSVIPRETESSR